MLFSTILLFRSDPPLGKMAANKEFPMPADGIRCGFAAVFCNKRTCPYCRQMKKLAKAIRLIPTLLLFLHKNGMGMDDRIRIKDIAAKAGVSVGTVDRVLHKRPNVSKSAREKVERILREIDYRPNAYASALACNKDYVFCCILPEHASEAYWEEI